MWALLQPVSRFVVRALVFGIGCFELLKGLLEHIVEELWNVRFDSKAAETRHALPRIEKISVIVAAHNEAACVGRTLRGLVAAAAAPAALEVIVVNAGSTDNGATQVSCIDTPTGSRRLPSEVTSSRCPGCDR